ncbi:MAG TPA: HD domain-containing phosphohydrolase [Pyrinomonadaceae bacterium]|nr:HD domain-containing phosphohydrolase [Pyrinomonadaceae bacterium]
MLEPFEGKPRILLIDDEPEVRNVLCELLSGDYDCEQASSAEEALSVLGVAEFDLVLSDIQMGGMSGLEMVPHVIKRSPDTVVVMVSGVSTIESAIEAMHAGAFDYVVKPFRLEHVEIAVRRALEYRGLRLAKHAYENHLEELVRLRTAELDGTLASLEDAYRSTLKALTAALDKRDSETSGHSERVVNFSLRLGRELGLGEGQLTSLEFGSLLHDIGKIGVPDAILRKPGALDEAEWFEMRKHPTHGQQILAGVRFLEGASRVVAEHHERWDGTGYPVGLRGEQIDLNARIFSVVDTFDAITSDRVYRKGRSYDAAIAELEEWSGRQFDPEVVEAFRRVPREEWEELRRSSITKSLEAAAETAAASVVGYHAGGAPRASRELESSKAAATHALTFSR